MNGVLAAKGTYKVSVAPEDVFFKSGDQKVYQWTAEKCSADEAFAKKAKSPGQATPKYSETTSGSIQDVINEGPFYPEKPFPAEL